MYLLTWKNAHNTLAQENRLWDHIHTCVNSYAALLGGRLWSTCPLAVTASQLQSTSYCLLCNAEAGPSKHVSFASSTCVNLYQQRALESSLPWYLDPNAFRNIPPGEQLSQSTRQWILSKFGQQSNLSVIWQTMVTPSPNWSDVSPEGGLLLLLNCPSALGVWMLVVFVRVLFISY